MNRTSTKKALRILLEGRTYKVIALTGVWGSGKTFLWNQLSEEAGIKAGYASLFGVSDRAEIKRRLGASLLRIQAKDEEGVASLWRSLRHELQERLSGLGEGYGWISAAAKVLGDVAGHRLLDELLRNQVLVLDDLERHASGLTIDALLGTIDELRALGATVVVILNEDELKRQSDSEKWDRFKEKAIDITLALQTTPADAFEAIASDIDPDLRHSARAAWDATRCRNIRIAQRVAQTIRTVFGDVRIDKKPLSALVADTVFLTVAEYRGLHPHADATETLNAHTRFSFSKESEEERRREEIRSASPVKFSHYHGFQQAVIGFLKTGHQDMPSFPALLSAVEHDYKAGDALGRLLDWRTRALWDPAATNEELRSEALSLLPEIWRLTPLQLQETVFGLKEIGAPQLAETAINQWCEEVLRRRISYDATPLPPPFKPIEPIDSRILHTASQVNKILNPPPSLLDALVEASRGMFSDAGIEVINDASVDDWLNLLLGATTREPFDIAHTMLTKNVGIDLGPAKENIASAFRRICKERPDTRLAQIILRWRLAPMDEMNPKAEDVAETA